MTKTEEFKMNKIVVFYDGNYFSEVSKFYRYHHERKARISFDGLHNFIKTEAVDYKSKISKVISSSRSIISEDVLVPSIRSVETAWKRIGILMMYSLGKE